MYENKKILATVVATILMVPVTTFAEVKLSGVVQAEMGSYRQGKWLDEDADYLRTTKDSGGALSNGGPDQITFDFVEKLAIGISGYGRYSVGFDTATNAGLTAGRDAWVGLKGTAFNLRFGKMSGAYKSSVRLIDPFYETSLQARGTAGGMTGSGYNTLYTVKKTEDGQVSMDDDNRPIMDKRITSRVNYSSSDLVTAAARTNHNNLAHSGYVSNALEIGAKYAGVSATFQGVFDETETFDSIGLAELRYTHGEAKDPSFVVFVAGSYIDFGDASSNQEDERKNNWKAGGQFNIKFPNSKLTVGLQYEDAELGTFDNDINAEGGQYLIGSLDYKMGNLALGGWVAGYKSDLEENTGFLIDGEAIEEDAIAFAVGFKYFFSKQTVFFGGYRQADSDNDYRDENVAGVGLSHSF